MKENPFSLINSEFECTKQNNERRLALIVFRHCESGFSGPRNGLRCYVGLFTDERGLPLPGITQ